MLAASRFDGPQPGSVVPAHAAHPCVEAHVSPQAEAVHHLLEIGENFRLVGITVRPAPLALQLLREGIGVIDREQVAARAGIAVVIPYAADLGRGFEAQHVQPCPIKAVNRVDTGKTGADDDHVMGFGIHRRFPATEDTVCT